jgi:hypothetical protein
MSSNQISYLLLKKDRNGKVNPIEKVHKIPAFQRQQGRFYEQKENHDKATAALLRSKRQEVS